MKIQKNRNKTQVLDYVHIRHTLLGLVSDELQNNIFDFFVKLQLNIIILSTFK